MSLDCKWSYLRKSKALPCPAGERIKPRHELERKGNNLHLVFVENIDIQERINSYEDGVSLEKMIGRFLRTGDMSHLTVKKGFFADVSGMETNPARAIDNLRKVTDAVASYNATTSDVDSGNDNNENMEVVENG